VKVYHPNDKGTALCHRDGRVSTTFAYRDLPFRDGRGKAKDILVGVCDTCGDAIVIPAQSTPAISAARKHVEHSMEINVPAFYMDLLDAAATRVASNVTPDFRKRLLIYYVNRYATGLEKPAELARVMKKSPLANVVIKGMPKKRLSMKLSDQASERIATVMDQTKLSKTELIKSLVAKINDDIVLPKEPKHLSELTTIAEVLYA
jgi:hypothetical protein